MKCLDEFSTYLCRQNVIREDELVVVQYGLNMFIANLSAFAITMMIAIMFHAMKCGICVFVLAFPLRKYAGGYHAKNKIACIIISGLILCTAFRLFLMPAWTPEVYGIIVSLLSGYIFVFAPVGTENKVLDVNEYKEYRKRTRMLLLLEMVLFFFSFCIKCRTIIQSVAISLFVVALCVWFGRRHSFATEIRNSEMGMKK